MKWYDGIRKLITRAMSGMNRERAMRWGWYGALVLTLAALGTASHAYRNRAVQRPAATAEPPRAVLAQVTPAPLPAPTPSPAPPTYVWPLEGEIIGPYAPDVLTWSSTLDQWQAHPGIDIAGSAGEAVMACADGTVADAWRDGLWGNVIEIEHPDGRRSRYAGVSTLKLVEPGDAVKAGEVISAVGQTASCEADLPWHLHFELTEGGESVDFEKIMANLSV